MGANLNRLVFQPPPSSYDKDPNLLWLRTEVDEVIPAFFIHRDDAHFTLLFSHGNAEDLGLIIRNFWEVSCVLRVNIFAYEYTGYGMSSGSSPKEPVLYTDINASFKYLRDELKVPWQQIVLYGRSIGTGPSCDLASRTAVRGVVLQSPMVSIYRIVFNFRFSLPGDPFRNIAKVRDMCSPVFIVHGTRDEIVPCWHGQALYDACVKRGIAYGAHWVEGADHNNLEIQAGDAFYEHIGKFLEHLQTTPISDSLQHQALVSTL